MVKDECVLISNFIKAAYPYGSTFGINSALEAAEKGARGEELSPIEESILNTFKEAFSKAFA